MANDSTDLSPQLNPNLSKVAFAFRGYNVTNLGRTAEFLVHDKYGPIIEEYLKRGTRVCADVTGRKVDLVDRVRRGRDRFDPAVVRELARESAKGLVMSVSINPGVQALMIRLGCSLAKQTVRALAQALERP